LEKGINNIYQVAIRFEDDKVKKSLQGHNKTNRQTHLIEGYDRFRNAMVYKSLSVTLVGEKHGSAMNRFERWDTARTIH
jgi:hypothetical protein